MNFIRYSFVPFVSRFFLAPLLLVAIVCSCESKQGVQEKEIVETPEEINAKAEDLIETTIEDLLNNPGQLPDSIKLKNAALLKEMYGKNEFGLLWSSEGEFRKEADSLFKLIDSSQLFGLFPSDYYAGSLSRLRNELRKDTAKETKLDAAKWAYADMLSTSAFIQLVKDLRFGRLLADSILVKDTALQAGYFSAQKQQFSTQPIDSFAASLEPMLKGYGELKTALRNFLPKAEMRSYTFIKGKDSTVLRRLVYQRISEEDSLNIEPDKKPDSLALATAIKKYQKLKKLKQDGKLSTQLIKQLNNTDREKFLRIAITLDKYKMLPALPEEYLWVNLPSYMMEVKQGDSVVLTSKIICGKPETKTPQLTSAISDMITYPKWTIPESIIKKEILPALKRNAGYTQKKGYSIVDSKGNEISPYTVNWAKYKNSIPYKVVQGSGDANALGVLKFNFANPYAVYLHDTNQRYLFDKKGRALSHGCVRVQKWRDLAVYLIRRDSLADSTNYTPVDSMSSWLSRKEKRYIKVRQQLPLFIRYFTAEGKEGKFFLHEDIYEEDRRIREKVFAGR
ncbi:MAG TPA: L,D-transpeptidase family protein [Flavisolibacter sp.]|nr:L,D-transpeptidase family protein [Flavisolibacter sp.]